MKSFHAIGLGTLVLVGCTIVSQPPPPAAAPAAAPPAPVAAAPTPAPTPAPTTPPPSGGIVAASTTAATPVGTASASGSVSWGNWKSAGGETPNTSCVKESNKELCYDGVDNNCDGQIDEGCPYQCGTLQFIIAWKIAVDLDLHVMGPDGKEVNWKMRDSGSLVLDKDCHGLKNGVDDCPTGKVENVYFPANRALLKGHYKVWVELFDSRGQGNPSVPFWFGAKAGVKTFGVPFNIANKPGEKKWFEFDVI
jgi:hypothetical protein